MSRKVKVASYRAVPAITVAFLMLCLGAAQETMRADEYQAQAMGQGTQMGQSFNVTVHIDEYSTPQERQALVDAFNKAGNQGLYNALGKMRSKGHIAITGTLGYDISFARQLPDPNGTKIRVLTSRPIRFGESWTDSRSSEYDLSGLELDLSSEKNKSTGVLLPACKFHIDKKTGELQIELTQNPWKLVDVMDRSAKKPE
jgi:hypothetical protein